MKFCYEFINELMKNRLSFVMNSFTQGWRQIDNCRGRAARWAQKQLPSSETSNVEHTYMKIHATLTPPQLSICHPPCCSCVQNAILLGLSLLSHLQKAVSNIGFLRTYFSTHKKLCFWVFINTIYVGGWKMHDLA